jgi:hypothetical protein
MYHPRKRGVGLFLALLLAVLTACGGGSTTSKATSPNGNASANVVESNSRRIAAFGSAVPGTEESLQELRDAKEAGFDELINYSSMNAAPSQVRSYLDEAQRLGVGIVYSIKDILGDKDADDANAALHEEHYGKTTDQQATAVTKQFVTHPAVTRVLISDELPGNRDDLDEWLPHLKKRYDQIKSITDKPVVVVLYWSGADPEFYGAVKKFADDFAIDFYPLPKNSRYGLESDIPAIGATLKQVAGDDGWFALQAFGWGATDHPEGEGLGYTARRYDAPNADQMVAMAKLAVEGGARNLIFYSLADPNRADLAQVKKAVAQIRAAPWWKQP